jgi:CCR4-NOT transcription complex subunit 6
MTAEASAAPTISRLRLLSDQPVEGCELSPDVFLTYGVSVNTARLDYHWYRSTDKMACSWCGKTPVVMQRLTDNTYYCTIACFAAAWPGHAAQHRTGLTSRPQAPRSNDPNAKGVDSQDWSSSFDVQEATEQKWVQVADTMSYTPSADDVGHMLKLACTPLSADGTRRGIAKTLKTNYVIAPPPPPTPRRMLSVRNNVVVSVGKPGAARTNANRLGFTLLTYNVLAEIYATNEAFPYCPQWALAWNYRRRTILRELINYRADVMCLQEVQADHYENFLEPELAKYNYAGVHKCKTREFMGQYGKMDGCAILYRRDKFSIVPGGVHEVEFNQIARHRHSNQKHELTRLLKDNVAQILLLELIAPHPSTRRQVLVANTHINASPEFADVKLWQTQHLLIEIEKVMQQHSGSYSAIPLVMAGDFNSLPGSDPHTLLANGAMVPENGDPHGLLATLPLSHHMPLRSAMATVGAHANASAESHELQRMEPPYTNYTAHFVGTLDYIFYTYDRLSVGGLLQMVEDKQVQEHEALPSPLFSSDHVPLLSEFHFKR